MVSSFILSIANNDGLYSIAEKHTCGFKDLLIATFFKKTLPASIILLSLHFINTRKLFIMENHNEDECIFCKRNDKEVPLVGLSFRGIKYSICPQHIPILIHEPTKLAGMLPGAEDMVAG